MAIDTSVYERQRRAVNDQYASNNATNQYARFVAQQRGQRQIGDYARQFGRSWPKWSASWGTRGMTGPGVQSGVYSQAMQDYVGDYQRGRNDIMQDYSNNMREYDLNTSRFQAERQRALADIEAAKQREIAMAAYNISALKPIIGGS